MPLNVSQSFPHLTEEHVVQTEANARYADIGGTRRRRRIRKSRKSRKSRIMRIKKWKMLLDNVLVFIKY